MRWCLENDGVFTVSSLYRDLVAQGTYDWMPRQFWKAKVPSKHKLLAWLVAHYRAPTRVVLRSFGMLLNEDHCELCGQESESFNHLFLRCSFSGYIWNTLTSLFSLPDVPKDVRELWTSWRSLNVNPSRRASYDMVVIAACWVIWIERNRRIVLK